MKNLFLKAFIVFLFACGVIILCTQKKEVKTDNIEVKGMRYSDVEINGSK
jgi:hypothetical protein